MSSLTLTFGFADGSHGIHNDETELESDGAVRRRTFTTVRSHYLAASNPLAQDGRTALAGPPQGVADDAVCCSRSAFAPDLGRDSTDVSLAEAGADRIRKSFGRC